MLRTIADVRPSPIAGAWYPGNACELATTVDRYLSSAHLPEISGGVIALVAPHAGLRYSGGVAGYAFAAARGLEPDLVAVVGPMHEPFPGAVLTSGHAAYVTPLGVVPLDLEAVEDFDARHRADLGTGLRRVRDDSEHSVEIELPFLQRALAKDFRLLPLMVRAHEPTVVEGLGRALAQTLRGRAAILVASTDLSHYEAEPVARRLDAEFLRRVERFDPAGVLSAEDEGAGYACGSGALAATLWAARALGATEVQVLAYATSGDVSGDRDRVVGYAAAVVTREPGS